MESTAPIGTEGNIALAGHHSYKEKSYLID